MAPSRKDYDGGLPTSRKHGMSPLGPPVGKKPGRKTQRMNDHHGWERDPDQASDNQRTREDSHDDLYIPTAPHLLPLHPPPPPAAPLVL
jgi:hypothetical protein